MCFRSADIPAKYEALPPIEGPLRRMDAKQIPNTVSDGHLVPVGTEQQFNTCKVQEKNKKIKKRPFKATTKPTDKDVPRMKVCVCLCVCMCVHLHVFAYNCSE